MRQKSKLFIKMVDMTLIPPLDKGQGHPFLVPIDFSYTKIIYPRSTFHRPFHCSGDMRRCYIDLLAI